MIEALRFLCLPLCWSLAVAGFAQQYRLAGVQAGRYEVTKRLDARPDTTALCFVTPYRSAVDSIMSPVLGESEVAMEAGRPESLLSNFVADVLRDASVRVGKRADIGLCNMGGLRAILPAGTVTYGDVLEVAPFENRLCVVALTGRKLNELFEQVAANGGEGISGARLAITRDGRLLTAEVGGKPVDPNAVYVVATLDYLAGGNDRLYALKDHLVRKDSRIAVRDLIVEAIRRATAQGHRITAKLEGRIVAQ